MERKRYAMQRETVRHGDDTHYYQLHIFRFTDPAHIRRPACCLESAAFHRDAWHNFVLSPSISKSFLLCLLLGITTSARGQSMGAPASDDLSGSDFHGAPPAPPRPVWTPPPKREHPGRDDIGVLETDFDLSDDRKNVALLSTRESAVAFGKDGTAHTIAWGTGTHIGSATVLMTLFGQKSGCEEDFDARTGGFSADGELAWMTMAGKDGGQNEWLEGAESFLFHHYVQIVETRTCRKLASVRIDGAVMGVAVSATPHRIAVITAPRPQQMSDDYNALAQWLERDARVDVFDFSGKRQASLTSRPFADAVPVDVRFVAVDGSLRVAHGGARALSYWKALDDSIVRRGPGMFEDATVHGFTLHDANAWSRPPRKVDLTADPRTTSARNARLLDALLPGLPRTMARSDIREFALREASANVGPLVAVQGNALWDVAPHGVDRKITALPMDVHFVAASPDGNRMVIDDRSGSTPMLFERETGRWFDVQVIEPLAANEEWLLSNDPKWLYRRKSASGINVYSRYGITPVLDAKDRWDGRYVYENAAADGRQPIITHVRLDIYRDGSCGLTQEGSWIDLGIICSRSESRDGKAVSVRFERYVNGSTLNAEGIAVYAPQEILLSLEKARDGRHETTWGKAFLPPWAGRTGRYLEKLEISPSP